MRQPVPSACLPQSLMSAPCHLLVPGPLASYLSDCKSFFTSPLSHSLLPSCSPFFPESQSLATSLSRSPGSRWPQGRPHCLCSCPLAICQHCPEAPVILLPQPHVAKSNCTPSSAPSSRFMPPGYPTLITCPTHTPWLSSWNCLEMTHLLLSLLY